MVTTKRRLSSFSTTVEVDVDIDVDDLHADGWHHQDECEQEGEWEGEAGRLKEAARALGAAVASLHRQAHPSAPSIRLCREEPCRSLTLDQLGQVDG